MDTSSSSPDTVDLKPPTTHRSAFSSRLTQLWIPMRAKITLPFILIALVMAAVIAFILYQIVFENIDQRFNTQLVESGKLASEWMVQEEDTRLAALRILAFTTGVGDALQARDPDTLRQIAWGSTVGTKEDAVEFLDSEGKLILSMRHRPGSIYLDDYMFATRSEVDYRQWDFVAQVLNGQTDSQGDKYSGLARAIWGDYFYVSGPVYDRAGEFAGVILVGESIANLVSHMRLDIGAQVTIYTLAGQPITSTFTTPLGFTSSLADSILARQTDSSLRRNNDNQRDLSYKSIDYGEILGPWKLRSHQDVGLIGTAVPKNLLVKTSTLVRTQLAIFVGLLMLIVILMGGIIANRITHPLQELVKASKEVAGGNLGVTVTSKTNDEMALLAENFNRMIASLQQSQTAQVNAYNSTLEGWSKATGLRDNETESHMQRVTDITIQLAKNMGLGGDQLHDIYRGALLHDIGKIGVPDAILKKPGKLTIDEWHQMRKHPQYAYDLLYSIDYLQASLSIPYCHHEKWDGSGYPRGIRGEEIPLTARIFAIVDVWDAMTSDRVYRSALPEEAAYKYIAESRGTHFDPQVVDAFLAMMEGFKSI